MSAVNALREDKILDIGEAVGSGDMTPADGRMLLAKRFNRKAWEAADDICFALDYGDREECDYCGGDGVAMTLTSATDPSCGWCDGQGSVYVG